MKLITFAIPSYNSEGYMKKCIESLLPGGEDVEIVIVDDGSTDGTAAIADEYAAKYPSIVRAIHQENAGHGGAVNAGLAAASGIYFKVVDSDDWVDAVAYKRVLETLRRLLREGTPVDMLLTNYVYEKIEEGKRRRMRYTLLFPQERVMTWEDMRHNLTGFPILMHSVCYRTQMLRKCGLELPKHTFYVDNLFVYEPLPYVKTLYYLNVDFYRYYIGRDGQSVAEATMIRRLDQQFAVNRRMISAYDLWSIKDVHLRRYMLSYLEIITVVSTSLAYVSKDPVKIAGARAIWDEIRAYDKRTYRKLRWGVLGRSMNLPGKTGRYISVKGYRVAQKLMKFN